MARSGVSILGASWRRPTLMLHVGLDLSRRRLDVCLLAGDGEPDTTESDTSAPSGASASNADRRSPRSTSQGSSPRRSGTCSRSDVRRLRDTRHPADHPAPPDHRGQARRPQAARCEHGEWRFAGSDLKRSASKWRCPTGECKPASVWVKADHLHPLVPRETPRFAKLYEGRGAVEREFGRLKNEWALAPLRVRGLIRARLHAT